MKIYKFYSSTCGPCRVMTDNLNKISEIQDIIINVNIEGTMSFNRSTKVNTAPNKISIINELIPTKIVFNDSNCATNAIAIASKPVAKAVKPTPADNIPTPANNIAADKARIIAIVGFNTVATKANVPIEADNTNNPIPKSQSSFA